MAAGVIDDSKYMVFGGRRVAIIKLLIAKFKQSPRASLQSTGRLMFI